MPKKTDFIGFILLGLLIILINAYFGQHPEIFQWDLTKEKIHTISAETINILREIDEPIELTLHFSEDLSESLPQIRRYSQSVKNLLARYANLSQKKIILKYSNPEPYSEAEASAIRLGLDSVPLGARGHRLFFGLVGTNSVDKQVVIPFFQTEREAFLEYDISKLIANLNQIEKKRVGVISGLSVFEKTRFAQQETSNLVFAQARELFDIRELEPDTKEIESDIDLLVLIQPNVLEPATLYAIDQFTLKGGKILAFVDPFAETLAGGPLQSEQHLTQLFNQWGLELTKDKILADADNALSIRLTPSGGPVRHPAVVGYGPEHFASSSPIVAQLERLNFSLPGVLTKIPSSQVEFMSLIVSSENTSLIDLKTYQQIEDPAELINYFDENKQTHTLAAQIKGPISSLFPNGPPEGARIPTNDSHKDKSQSPFHAIIVADVDFLTDRLWVNVQHFLGQNIYDAFANNGDFIVNAMDTLLGNSTLIGIRSREVSQRPFTKIAHLKRDAEAKFRQQEQALKQQLSLTEEKLAALQSARGVTGVVSFNEEQKQTLSGFIEEKSKLSESLREVQHQLNRDIEALGTLLKLLNILLIPVLITLIALIRGLLQTRANRRYLASLHGVSHG